MQDSSNYRLNNLAALSTVSRPFEHRRKKLFGKSLSVITLHHQDFLIGVQIATLLKRETFNMYRSMKIKQIELLRASPDQVEYCVRAGAVRSGTHSITLVPYEQGMAFVSEGLEKQKKSDNYSLGKFSSSNWVSKADKKKTTVERQDNQMVYSESSRLPSVASLLNPIEESPQHKSTPVSPLLDHADTLDAPNGFSAAKSLSKLWMPHLTTPDVFLRSADKIQEYQTHLPPATEDPLWTLLITAQEVLV